MPIQIRQARSEDAHAIARLQAGANDRRAPLDHIAGQLADPTQTECAWLAEIDGAVVGLASLRISPRLFDPLPYAELTELLVATDHRRQGVGRTLLQHCEAQARQAGATELVLMTAPGNTRAHTFYYQLSYQRYANVMRRQFATRP